VNKAEPSTISLFTRSLIVFLYIVILFLLFYSFFNASTPAVTGELLVLVGILVVLTLSEAFDNFSLGSLLTLSRSKKITETKAKNLEQENIRLTNQIVAITSISQNTSNTVNVAIDKNELSQQDRVEDDESSNEIRSEGFNKLSSGLWKGKSFDYFCNMIKLDLDKAKLDYSSEASILLIEHLAGSQIKGNFEYILRTIFSSQVKLLKRLRLSIDGGLSKNDVNSQVVEILTSNKVFEDWDVEKYLEFLYKNNYLSDSEDSVVQLTDTGIDFLDWMKALDLEPFSAL
jgi:hypothetical protein